MLTTPGKTPCYNIRVKTFVAFYQHSRNELCKPVAAEFFQDDIKRYHMPIKKRLTKLWNIVPAMRSMNTRCSLFSRATVPSSSLHTISDHTSYITRYDLLPTFCTISASANSPRTRQEMVHKKVRRVFAHSRHWDLGRVIIFGGNLDTCQVKSCMTSVTRSFSDHI